MKKKATIKVPPSRLLSAIGYFLAVYGDGFGDWLMENKERLMREYQADLEGRGHES